MKNVSIFSHVGAEGKFWNLIFKVLIFENTLKRKGCVVDNTCKSLYLNFSHVLIYFSQF
jgi:hypothetical protein